MLTRQARTVHVGGHLTVSRRLNTRLSLEALCALAHLDLLGQLLRGSRDRFCGPDKSPNLGFVLSSGVSFNPADDVHGELLNEFGLHFGCDAVVFLLALASVEQSRDIALNQLPGNSCCVRGGIPEEIGNL